MSRTTTWWALVAALAGCTAPEEEVIPSPAEPLLGADLAVRWVVDSAAGPAPVSTWARALNGFGASVAASPLTLTVDGVAVTTNFDATGYGTVTWGQVGAASVTGAEAPAQLLGYATQWPGFGAHPVHPSALPGAERAIAVTTGVVLGLGNTLVWAAPDGRNHTILEAEGTLVGVRAVKIDVDDFLDVVAWDADKVYLLRARPDGGLGWAGGFSAAGYTVGGADVGDLNGDNLPDLAIAWSSAEDSQLDVWNGDGIYGFTAAQPRNLPEIPIDLSIGDNTGEGTNQITVLDAVGGWGRYIAGNDTEYMPIGPNKPDQLIIPAGSTLTASGDMHADRAEDLWIAGPYVPGQLRVISVVDLKGTQIEFVKGDAPSAYVDIEDADGNTVQDLMTVRDDRTLWSLSYEVASTGAYTPRKLETLPVQAPFAMTDWIDGDGMADLFLGADDNAWWWRGVNNPNDDQIFWGIEDPLPPRIDQSTGAIIPAEIDGDPSTREILTFELDDGEQELNVQQILPDGTLVWHGQVNLIGITGRPLDGAFCKGSAYLLFEGTAARVAILDMAKPDYVIKQDSDATRVDCGDLAGGARAAYLRDGFVSLVGLSLYELSTIDAPDAGDVAVADLGLADEVAWCEGEGCRIAPWPGGLMDEAAFVRAEGGTITIPGYAPVPGAGEITVGDADSDGILDVIAATPEGVITTVRVLGDQLAPVQRVSLWNGLLGPVHLKDNDADGWNDLLFSDGEGVRLTLAPGAFAPQETTTTSSTDVTDSDVTDTGPTDTGAGSVP